MLQIGNANCIIANGSKNVMMVNPEQLQRGCNFQDAKNNNQNIAEFCHFRKFDLSDNQAMSITKMRIKVKDVSD